MSAASELNPAQFSNVWRPLEEAETLPPWCYTSPAFYQAEVEHIFLKTWNFLGREDRIPNPGDYFALDFVGVPLVVVRGHDGVVRAFANTCRHRGTRIAKGEGNCRIFTCPYHAWAYELDGRLRGAVGMEECRNFKREDYGLLPIRLESWGGFIFVNFDPEAESLEEYLGDFTEQFASYHCEDLVTTRRQEYQLSCNWKFYIENAMEEYHVPQVHRVSIGRLNRAHGILETNGNWDAIREKHEGTRALLEEDQDKAFPPITTLEGPLAEGTHFVCLYPATMLGMTKDCVWWLEQHPMGPDQVRLTVGSCFPKETIERDDFEERVRYYYKRWDQSIGEDNDISEIQQAGINSPFARPGRLSPMEPLVHSIAKWVLGRVLGSSGPAAPGSRPGPASKKD